MRVHPLTAHEAKRHFEAGIHAFNQGDHPQALTHLQRAITSYPGYAQAHYLLGLTLSQQQRFEAAAQAVQQALRVYPRYEEAHTLR